MPSFLKIGLLPDNNCPLKDLEGSALQANKVGFAPEVYPPGKYPVKKGGSQSRRLSQYYPAACIGLPLGIALFGCSNSIEKTLAVNPIYTVYFSEPQVLFQTVPPVCGNQVFCSFRMALRVKRRCSILSNQAGYRLKGHVLVFLFIHSLGSFLLFPD